MIVPNKLAHACIVLQSSTNFLPWAAFDPISSTIHNVDSSSPRTVFFWGSDGAASFVRRAEKPWHLARDCDV